ncbi:hypothetical protein P3T76_010361 [Phytophthora citrophthora]|uniref:Uncharacterized protein n=1 Tax=Phytophthora citrophthora TaxID=4793 RepID=A0AAD9GBX3_9STRA|nr:hypothetical protein P3T76_010361 [Phytophthora citrophthora]
MTIMVGDTVLISHGSVLLDAEVKELQSDIETGEETIEKPVRVLVQYPVESERQDEWVMPDRVLEDTQTNRELQQKINAINQQKNELTDPSATFEKFCGPKRLDAIAAWMNSVDDALFRLERDVKDLEMHQASHTAQLNELERRKKEAIGQKGALEASVLQDLKRVRVAEETAMARKRLQNAGVSQDEIDAILPVIRHEGQH